MSVAVYKFRIYVKNLKESLLCIPDCLEREGSQVKASSYVYLLRECIRTKALVAGQILHAHILEDGTHASISLCTTLIDMYSKSGRIEDARAVFDRMSHHNVVSWTAMIAGYAHDQDTAEKALVLFDKMHDCAEALPNEVTFLSILNASANLGSLESGRLIHAWMMETGKTINVFVENALVNMYVKSDDVEDAFHVFWNMCTKDVVTWTVLVNGCAKEGLIKEALQLFHQMECEGMARDKGTFVCILRVCAISKNLSNGRRAHAVLIGLGFTPDVMVESSLVDMYCKCGSIDEAKKVFNRMEVKNVVSWNSLLLGYAKQEMVEGAFRTYQKMMKSANQVTFITILKVCASNGDLESGRGIHMDSICRGLDHDVSVGNALMDMYINCEELEDAQRTFDRLRNKTVISWTEMIAGYMTYGYVEEANHLFREMEQDGILPNEVTFLSMIIACSAIGHLEQSMLIHSKMTKIGRATTDYIANALIDMYAKCGDIHAAYTVFMKSIHRDVITWNAIVLGYALHGCVRETLLLAERMQQTGIRLNEVTFLGMLTACSRAGLIEEGLFVFRSMVEKQQIVPTADHLVCMVDLLARVGYVKAGEEILKHLPLDISAVVWRALLNACRLHGCVESATSVIENLLECERQDASSFALLANIVAAA